VTKIELTSTVTWATLSEETGMITATPTLESHQIAAPLVFELTVGTAVDEYPFTLTVIGCFGQISEPTLILDENAIAD